MAEEIRGISEEIEDYLKAGYSCLFLRTIEPHLAEETVRLALVNMGLAESHDFGVWKITTGLVLGKAAMWDKEGFTPRSESVDLESAIEMVGKRTKDNPIVCVFHHLRQFIEDPNLIQTVIDSSIAAKAQGCHLVVVGPHCELPLELKNFVTFIDFPLPSRQNIEDIYTAMVEYYSNEVSLPNDKKDKEELIKSAANAAVGLDSMGAENAMSLSLVSAREVNLSVIQKQKEQEVRKSDVLEFFPNQETIDNLGGYDAMKDWLSKRKRAFTEEARQYGLRYPKGILIVGFAGTGKSLAAKCVSNYLGLPLLRWDMGKVYRSLVGESEASTRMALKVAEAVSPCVLWIDEIEKGLAGMRSSGELDGGVTARVVSTILTWRQETEFPVLLVATSNDVSTLPSMVYRPGRMDQVWATDLPKANERKDIFSIHIAKRNRDPKDYKIEMLSKRAVDFTGAEIEYVIDEAMYMAFSDHKEFEDKHILNAMDNLVPQAKRDSDELEAIRKWADSKARSVSYDNNKSKAKGGKGSNTRLLKISKKKK